MKDQATETSTESSTDQAKTESKNEQESSTQTESTPKTVTLTESELDRIIGERVFKAQKNLENKQKQEKGQWEDLYKSTQEELENLKKEKEHATFVSQVVELASSKNLAEFSDVLSKLPDIDSVKLAVEKLSNSMNQKIRSEVDSKIKTPSPVKNVENATPTSLSAVKNLDDFKSWKQANDKR